jgi:hypothetical protein
MLIPCAPSHLAFSLFGDICRIGYSAVCWERRGATRGEGISDLDGKLFKQEEGGLALVALDHDFLISGTNREVKNLFAGFSIESLDTSWLHGSEGAGIDGGGWEGLLSSLMRASEMKDISSLIFTSVCS